MWKLVSMKCIYRQKYPSGERPRFEILLKILSKILMQIFAKSSILNMEIRNNKNTDSNFSNWYHQRDDQGNKEENDAI